jgi:hypothetical protein
MLTLKKVSNNVTNSGLVDFLISEYSAIQEPWRRGLFLKIHWKILFYCCKDNLFKADVEIPFGEYQLQKCYIPCLFFVTMKVQEDYFNEYIINYSMYIHNPSIQWRYSPNQALASSVEVP